MYCKYCTVENIASSVSQYESYRDQVYRYTPTYYLFAPEKWSYAFQASLSQIDSYCTVRKY